MVADGGLGIGLTDRRILSCFMPQNVIAASVIILCVISSGGIDSRPQLLLRFAPLIIIALAVIMVCVISKERNRQWNEAQ